MSYSPEPPCLAAPADVNVALQQHGFALLQASHVAQASGVEAAALQAWGPYWDDLPADAYLRDGGRYRRRRHSSFIVRGPVVEQVPHRPHWQPVEYNALHGGLERHFEPMPAEWVAQAAWKQLLVWLGSVASALRGSQAWFVEAHPFRIDTTDGIGRPTPEGAHRDGVDLVAVFMVQRHQIKGGETRVFDAQGPAGQRFTLKEPWSVLLLDDHRVIHETTPVQPAGALGWRDTLVLTYRAGAFQDVPDIQR